MRLEEFGSRHLLPQIEWSDHGDERWDHADGGYDRCARTATVLDTRPKCGAAFWRAGHRGSCAGCNVTHKRESSYAGDEDNIFSVPLTLAMVHSVVCI